MSKKIMGRISFKTAADGTVSFKGKYDIPSIAKFLANEGVGVLRDFMVLVREMDNVQEELDASANKKAAADGTVNSYSLIARFEEAMRKRAAADAVANNPTDPSCEITFSDAEIKETVAEDKRQEAALKAAMAGNGEVTPTAV